MVQFSTEVRHQDIPIILIIKSGVNNNEKYSQIYQNYFFGKNVNSLDEISASEKSNLYVSQIIAYAILRKKSIIEKIKEEVGA